jgi:NADP-dependent 3-hydroxy acid dehydrogenase YdfG
MADTPELQALAAKYMTFQMLSAKDIADAVQYVISAPPHVSIRELIISPTDAPN